MSTENDIIEVVRIIRYIGPRNWVETSLKKALPSNFSPKPGCFIQSTYVEMLSTKPLPSFLTQQEPSK